MTTQAALRRSLWSEQRIHYEHGRSPVTYVYRHDGGRAEPLTVIAQSAILKRLGITGWGLYAERPMKEGVELLHAIQDVYLNDEITIA